MFYLPFHFLLDFSPAYSVHHMAYDAMFQLFAFSYVIMLDDDKTKNAISM